MNKSELIDAVAIDTGTTKAAAKIAVDAVLGNISSALANGGDVAIAGFGSFSVKHRTARTGRNPQTGAAIQIPAKKIAVFKAGKGLNDSL